jgi:hypothetical protein
VRPAAIVWWPCQLRSARAGRIGLLFDPTALVSLLLPVLMLPDIGALPEDVPEPPEALLFCDAVPVVPIGPPAGLCWPAAVAGLGDAVVGGVPCAKAVPAAASASAVTIVEVLFMASLLDVGEDAVRHPESRFTGAGEGNLRGARAARVGGLQRIQ